MCMYVHVYIYIYTHIHTHTQTQCSLLVKLKCISYYTTAYFIYTGCPRRNVPDFGRVFLMLKYTDITQNTYVQS